MLPANKTSFIFGKQANRIFVKGYLRSKNWRTDWSIATLPNVGLCIYMYYIHPSAFHTSFPVTNLLLGFTPGCVSAPANSLWTACRWMGEVAKRSHSGLGKRANMGGVEGFKSPPLPPSAVSPYPGQGHPLLLDGKPPQVYSTTGAWGRVSQT